MNNIPENVRQAIIKLIPSSLTSDIACFVFYDNHPMGEKNIDITVCTKNGELKEFFQRDLLSSLHLNCVLKPTHIRILRKEDSKLHYLVTAQDELFIISSDKKLQIHKKIFNIDRYDVNDTACSGKPCLKVYKKDDAVPLLINSCFEIIEDEGIIPNTQGGEDCLPILTELKSKLVEARFTAKSNENMYLQYLKLRQNVSMVSKQQLQPNLKDSVCYDNSENIPGALKLKTNQPWIKVCNKKILLCISIINEGDKPLENIHMLLKNATTPSLVYTTKLFAKTNSLPFWYETNIHELKPRKECALVAVMNLDEIKLNVNSGIELGSVVSYTMSMKEYLLPLEDIGISSSELIGDEFDVLSSSTENHAYTILAILASTEKTELCYRHIRNDDEAQLSVLELFCTHLQMERIANADNVIVYKKSPYHALNGIIIIFHKTRMLDKRGSASLHTRSPKQVLAFLHYLYDAIPAKIIVTTPKYKITAKSDDLSQYDEEITITSEYFNYMGYAVAILDSSKKILEHLDNSMIKMNESKNPSVLSKVGSYIDVFAGGVENFKEFRDGILEEPHKGIDSLMNSKRADNTYRVT